MTIAWNSNLDDCQFQRSGYTTVPETYRTPTTAPEADHDPLQNEGIHILNSPQWHSHAFV
jgi:hypothetical protein